MKLASIEAIARALTDAHVQFIVVGGLAVNAHGYGRYTNDLDLVIRLELLHIRRAFEALASLGYRPRVNFHSDQHRQTPIDVFVSEPFDFEREYDRALIQEVAPGVAMHIVSLPTLVRLKQAAGRPQDLADLSELRVLHGDAIDG